MILREKREKKLKRERKLRGKGEYFRERERERRVFMVGGGEREREREEGQVVTWNSAATARRGEGTRGVTRTVSGTCDFHVWEGSGGGGVFQVKRKRCTSG